MKSKNVSRKRLENLWMIPFGIFAVTVVFGQIPNPDVDREVIVMFKPAVLELPADAKASMVSELVSVTPQLRNVLVGHQVNRIRRAFPDFSPADTLSVTPEGQIIKLNLLDVFVLRVPVERNRPSLIVQLNRMEDVLYAEPNAEVQFRYEPNDEHFPQQWNLKDGSDPSNSDIETESAWT